MHAAPVFSGAHIQAQMQPRFNAPMAPVGRQEGGPIQLGPGTRTQEIFRGDFVRWKALAINAAGQACGLGHEGKVHRAGGGLEGDQTPDFIPAAVDLAGLGDRLRG